jgi:hypothetical protein
LLKSNEVDEFAVEPEHRAQPGITEAQRTCRDAIEYRLYVCWRAADHSQNLTRRGLTVESLLSLVEQSDVLDCDYRLVGKRLEQRDLRR